MQRIGIALRGALVSYFLLGSRKTVSTSRTEYQFKKIRDWASLLAPFSIELPFVAKADCDIKYEDYRDYQGVSEQPEI